MRNKTGFILLPDYSFVKLTSPENEKHRKTMAPTRGSQVPWLYGRVQNYLYRVGWGEIVSITYSAQGTDIIVIQVKNQ